MKQIAPRIEIEGLSPLSGFKQVDTKEDLYRYSIRALTKLIELYKGPSVQFECPMCIQVHDQCRACISMCRTTKTFGFRRSIGGWAKGQDSPLRSRRLRFLKRLKGYVESKTADQVYRDTWEVRTGIMREIMAMDKEVYHEGE